MGLLDDLIGNVFGAASGRNQRQDPLSSVLGGLAGGSQGQSGNLLLQLALSLLKQNGGLEGVLGRFRQGGLGQQADSWVSNGENMNISANELQQIFGSSTLRDLASQLGMPEEQAGSTMAQVLPELINHLTPQGQVPANGDEEIAQGLSMLANPELLRRV
ncbi:MAG TPA: YidB family protein [Candidatus Binatia bacterium]